MVRVFSESAPATISGGVVLMIGAMILGGNHLGPLSLHMSMHIVAMNIVAPLAAALLVKRYPRAAINPRWVWAAALGQITALAVAHVPSAQSDIAASHLLQVCMYGILLLTSLWFWMALLMLTDARRWHAVAALLLSGKLVCFLAALIVFAPRALYRGHSPVVDAVALADQQFAGLLMIAACPLSYLLAAIIITVQLINVNITVRPSPATS